MADDIGWEAATLERELAHRASLAGMVSFWLLRLRRRAALTAPLVRVSVLGRPCGLPRSGGAFLRPLGGAQGALCAYLGFGTARHTPPPAVIALYGPPVTIFVTMEGKRPYLFLLSL